MRYTITSIIFFTVLSCSKSIETEAMEIINEQINKTGDSCNISLKTLYGGNWDEIHMLGGFDNVYISDTLGVPFEGRYADDGEDLIVIMKNKKIKTYFYRSYGSSFVFFPDASHKIIKKEDVFCLRWGTPSKYNSGALYLIKEEDNKIK